MKPIQFQCGNPALLLGKGLGNCVYAFMGWCLTDPPFKPSKGLYRVEKGKGIKRWCFQHGLQALGIKRRKVFSPFWLMVFIDQ